jgi:cyclopentanol dehydrogenase
VFKTIWEVVMRLKGKVAIVTGGAKGIGGAAVTLFGREGAKVVVGDIDEPEGQKKAADVREAGGEAIFVRMDVTTNEDWRRIVKETLSRYSKIDVLVNNAGIGNRNTLLETTEEQWDQMMEIDAKSCFLGMKHVIPIMQKQGGGSIINVSSIYGLVGSPGSAAYHAAKGAVRLITKAAAIQHAKENIRVNSIHPGFTLTEGTREPFSHPEIAQPRLGRTPMGRFGEAMEIAYGILFLASDESSYCTGSELVIDGGTTAW